MRIGLLVCLTIVLLGAALPACAQVSREYLELAGWAEPNTPTEHNRLAVLRYWPEGKSPTAGVILISGNGGGAPSFDIIGRWLAGNAGVEVWAVDRRSNHLEDHTGTDQAVQTGDIMAGGMYYYSGQYKPVNPADVQFMKYWGLPTHLNDIHALVQQMRSRGIKDIFLGGHSLGALMTQAYAAYALPDGKRAADDLRGLILFDGSIWAPSGRGDLDKRIADGQARISEGIVFAPDQPRLSLTNEMIAIAASRDPDGTSMIAPYVQDLTSISSPLTNLALFGVALDTDYSLRKLSRCGRLADADPNNASAPRGWISYDKCGEVTDAAALAKAVVAGHGSAEWYQPLALMLDIGKAARAGLDSPELGLKCQKDMKLPVIAFLANAKGYDFAEGLKAYAAAIKGRTETHTIDPSGTYAHLDPIVAADADKRVFTPVKEWMAKILAGK